MLHLASLHQEHLSHSSIHLCGYYNKLAQRQKLQNFNMKSEN